MLEEPPAPSERDQQALRLALAFYCIMEPEKRREVLALAEKCADPDALASAAFDQHAHRLR